MMKIELKKVKVYPEMSQETTCFSAVLYLDGKRACPVHNDGHGDCHHYNGGWTAEEHLNQYAKTLPKRDIGEGIVVQPDADMLVNDLVWQHQEAKEQKKLHRKERA